MTNPSDLVQHAYGLTVREIHPVPGGHTARKYHLTTDRGDLLLRIRPAGATPEELDADHRFMAHLRRHRVPVPEVLRTRDGCTWVRDGDTLAELQSFIPHDADLTSFTFPAVSSTICQALGRLHNASLTFTESIRKPSYLGSTLVPLGETEKYFTGPLEHGVPRFRTAADELPASVRAEFLRHVDTMASLLVEISADYRAARERGPVLVNHNDFYGNNILFANGKIAGIVDFDFCQSELYVVDLVEALHGAMIWNNEDERYLGLAEAGHVRPRAGREALLSYLQELPSLEPDGRFLIRFLIAKVISLAFYPAFDFWESAAEKLEGIRRVTRTVEALEAVHDLVDKPTL